jgi:hypothetical protein
MSSSSSSNDIMSHPLVEKLKKGKPTTGEWSGWKSDYQIASKEIQKEVSSFVNGKKIKAHPLSNSFHRLDERFTDDTNEIKDVENQTMVMFDDQPEARERVQKLHDEIDLLSRALVSTQAEVFLKNLDTMVKTHQSRLLSYAGLCAQREIVREYQETTAKENRSKLSKEIERLEGRVSYFDGEVQRAYDDDIRRGALARRDEAKIQLNKAKDELANLKGDEIFVSDDHLNDFQTQAYGDEEEEEVDEDDFLTLKTKFKNEYETRNTGGKKRKALPDGASSSPSPEKKQTTGLFWRMMGYGSSP